jgi:uridine phosphorylase
MSGVVRRRGGPKRVYHLDLRPGDMPSIVLVPGDVDRVERIQASWQDARCVARKREFLSYRGRYRDVELGVTSTGIGGPAMSIAVEELAQVGVRTLLRVGSCGGLRTGMRPGDLVITKACLRLDGASAAYAPLGYPASADPEVFLALVEAAKDLGVRYHTGITATVDTFYASQGRPGFRGYLPPGGGTTLADLKRLGVANIEMESATLLTLANLHGLRAGAVCAVFDVAGQKVLTPKGEDAAVHVANEAAYRLSRARP